MTYTTAQGNAGSLTHWARPGIKPATSWFLVGFVYIVPWQELHISAHMVFDSHRNELLRSPWRETTMRIIADWQTQILFPWIHHYIFAEAIPSQWLRYCNSVGPFLPDAAFLQCSTYCSGISHWSGLDFFQSCVAKFPSIQSLFSLPLQLSDQHQIGKIFPAYSYFFLFCILGINLCQL